MHIASVFEVTDFKTNEQWEETVTGCGQEVINYLRNEYPRFTKFVLVGFEVGDKYFQLDLRK